jgi:hypothetical protein
MNANTALDEDRPKSSRDLDAMSGRLTSIWLMRVGAPHVPSIFCLPWDRDGALGFSEESDRSVEIPGRCQWGAARIVLDSPREPR